MNLYQRSNCFLLCLFIWLIPFMAAAFQEERLLEQEEVISLLENHLQKMIQDPKKRIELKDLRGGDKILLPKGVLSYEVSLPEQAYRGGNFSASILFLINGREAKKVRVSGRIDLYAEVVVARQSLRKHDEIQEKDVQLATRNISFLPQDVVTEVETILGQRTTMTINGREVIRRSMVEVPPLVKKGDRVLMAINNSQFKITTWGEIKEEGRRGDRVKLINLSSKREVYGKVLDSNTVQVEF
jgi:flagellar basal body P-ring formation protein FlgA